MNIWDEAVKLLHMDRLHIKKQFYIAVYDRIRTREQGEIVTTVLKLGSPLSVKAETNNNKKRRGNYGIIRQATITKTKPLPGDTRVY